MPCRSYTLQRLPTCGHASCWIIKTLHIHISLGITQNNRFSFSTNETVISSPQPSLASYYTILLTTIQTNVRWFCASAQHKYTPKYGSVPSLLSRFVPCRMLCFLCVRARATELLIYLMTNTIQQNTPIDLG